MLSSRKHLASLKSLIEQAEDGPGSMNKRRYIGFSVGASLLILLAAPYLIASHDRPPIFIAVATMARVATVDPRFQSYNVEMAEVIGGKFWKPYNRLSKVSGNAEPTPAISESNGAALQIGQDPALFEARPPIDLSNVRLRKLAAALGPAYVRVSGTWANTVYFQDSDDALRTGRQTDSKGF